jgi:MFS family permease
MVEQTLELDSLEEPFDPRPVSWTAIVAVVLSVSVFALTLGLTYPLLALILEGQGVDETWIGLNAAMTSLGVIVFAPVVPRVAVHLGAWRLAIICLIATMGLFVLLGAFRTMEAWFAVRFLLGVAINGLFVVSETWINQLVTPQTRGRVMGLYSTVLSLGFAIGPFLLPVTGIEGWAPFWVGVAGAAISLVALILVRDQVPAFTREAQGTSLVGFLPLAPVLLAAVATFSFYDQAVLSFWPLYGLRYGLTETTVANALGVLIIGNVFLQFPLGWLADRTSRRGLMLFCAAAAVVGSLVLPLAITRPLILWPLLFFWGGLAFGVYTMALIELGDRFSGALLLAGNAAFALMWGVGGIIGPPVTGGVMQLVGPNGLPLVLGVTYGLFTILLATRQFAARQPTSAL